MTFWRSAHDCKEKGKWAEETSDGIETKSWEGDEVEIVFILFSFHAAHPILALAYLDIFAFICILFLFVTKMESRNKILKTVLSNATRIRLLC